MHAIDSRLGRVDDLEVDSRSARSALHRRRHVAHELGRLQVAHRRRADLDRADDTRLTLEVLHGELAQSQQAVLLRKGELRSSLHDSQRESTASKGSNFSTQRTLASDPECDPLAEGTSRTFVELKSKRPRRLSM